MDASHVRTLPYVALAAFLLGATAPPPALAVDPARAPVAVRWWGQAFVTIETWWGLTIAIDPYDPARTGYTDPGLRADAVLVTHEHFDHNDTGIVQGGPHVVRGLKDDRVADLDLTLSRSPNERAIKLATTGDPAAAPPHSVRVRTIASWHDNTQGSQRGPNAMFLIETDGVRILHAGDLGQSSLTPAQLDAIGPVDVLLLPVGGTYTIDAGAAARITRQLSPRYVVPIHFATWPLKITLDDASRFFASLGERTTRLDAVGNTLAAAALEKDATPGDTIAVSLKFTPWRPPKYIADGLAKVRVAREAMARTIESLSADQLDHKPADGTHTVRWNAEHTAGAEMSFMSLVFHSSDDSFPKIRISPAQMPEDYSPANPDWTGTEEADHIRRVGAFSERFAYLLDGVAPNEERYPAFFKSLNGLFDLLENHYNHHLEKVKAKFLLEDWPSQ